MAGGFVKAAVPAPVRSWLRTRRQRWVRRWHPSAALLGALRQLQPVSRVFGFDRGLCIDRYYIEQFLARQAGDIRGRVLEVADRDYTVKFGGARVKRSDVLHAPPGSPRATLVGDLSRGEGLPSDAFDCIVLTQTLQFIYDAPAAVRTLHRMLKPGGVLLITVPGISQISRYDMDRWGEYWRFTTRSVQRLLDEAFAPSPVSVSAFGNVLAAAGLLHGLAAEELSREELEARDPDYEVLIAARAVKRAGS